MTRLPTGTVTFLFTDIEGSTRLLSRIGTERYAAVLAQHHSLLRAALATHDGVEVNTTGDGFFAAFDRAADGVSAAVDMQRALASHLWPDDEAVRVRIGIHTGDGVLGGDSYAGLAVHRAARISAAAHGGQVLVSQTTNQLTGDGLPAGVGVRDIGEHRLKDLSRGQRLYQLVIEGLDAEFPPVRTLGVRPTNLPIQPTPLIGRQREIGELVALLGRDEARLLTLTGPGGTGKTRLAVQVAAEAIEEYTDGAYLVSLAALSEPQLVPQAIADALGIREPTSARLADALVEYLREKRILLVLDNFEHLLSSAPCVSELLGASPDLRVLVTSRAPLRLRAEHEYRVDPLQLPDPGTTPSLESILRSDAVSLFADRARAVEPRFQVTKDNAMAIADICARLDGLPLAIELAAARIRILSLPALAERLEEGLTLLARGGAQDLPDRQRGLRQMVEWSHGLLNEPQQQLFERLAVFSGGCTLSSAAAICDPDRALAVEIIDGIAALTESSLLRRDEDADGQARFSMLETIRAYGLDRLEQSKEVDRLRLRHAEYFRTLAERAGEELRGAGESRWLDLIDVEYANFRAALGWANQAGEVELQLRIAGALWIYWLARGHLSEGWRWLEQALRGDGGAPAARADALVAAAALKAGSGHPEATRGMAQESRALYAKLGDAGGVARSLTFLGHAAASEGDPSGAREFHEQSVAAARAVGGWDLAVALNNLGDCLLDLRDPGAATDVFQEALSLSRDLAQPDIVGRVLLGLGYAALAFERSESAMPWLHEALEIFLGTDDKLCLSGGLVGMSALASNGRQAARAARLMGAADALRDEVEPGLMCVGFEAEVRGQTLEAVREALGETAALDEYAKGRALPPARAVAAALSAPAPEPGRGAW